MRTQLKCHQLVNILVAVYLFLPNSFEMNNNLNMTPNFEIIFHIHMELKIITKNKNKQTKIKKQCNVFAVVFFFSLDDLFYALACIAVCYVSDA